MIYIFLYYRIHLCPQLKELSNGIFDHTFLCILMKYLSLDTKFRSQRKYMPAFSHYLINVPPNPTPDHHTEAELTDRTYFGSSALSFDVFCSCHVPTAFVIVPDLVQQYLRFFSFYVFNIRLKEEYLRNFFSPNTFVNMGYFQYSAKFMGAKNCALSFLIEQEVNPAHPSKHQHFMVGA